MTHLLKLVRLRDKHMRFTGFRGDWVEQNLWERCMAQPTVAFNVLAPVLNWQQAGALVPSDCN